MQVASYSWPVTSMLPALGLIALLSQTATSAQLTTSSTPPTSNILASYTERFNTGAQSTFAYRSADPAGTEGTRGRGQSFQINADTAPSYAVTAITLFVADSSSIPAGASLDVDVFSLGLDPEVPATGGWLSGDGNADGDILDGTGYVSLFRTTLDISGRDFSAGSTFSLEFGSGELSFFEDRAYGIFYQYRLDDVSSLTSDQTIRFQNSTMDDAPGDLLASFDTANTTSNTRDLRFIVQGLPVPEPTSLMTACCLLCCMPPFLGRNTSN